MALQNGFNGTDVLWERAKELLKKEDYERLKVAIKTFSNSKTRSVEALCSDLLKIVNSRSKAEILTEVRQCLPRYQRNTFTRHCNELLETAREQGDLEKKRKIERKRSERENSAPNFQGSPAKKTRKGREKSSRSRKERRVSDRLENLGNQSGKVNGVNDVKSDGLGSQGEVHRIVIMERKSLNQGFGFRIRGGTFHQPSITIAQVAKDSIAERQRLKIGDKILRVNGQRCGRNGLEIAQIIGIIKAEKSIRLRIISAEVRSKNECKNQVKGDRPAGEAGEKRLSTVSVYPDEDGWLGCCIRGGKDYACAVHVISVDNGSPAERAGVKRGDVIVELNGTSTKDLTHVQVVRLVISSGRCVQLTLKPGRKQHRHSSRPHPHEVQPTPLRTQYRGSRDVTPPGSPTYRPFHLPGYPHNQGAAVDSPSQLPMDVMRLDFMPPPPYTPEVPSRHRLLAKGGEGQEPQGSPHQHLPEDTCQHQDPQGSSSQDIAQETPNQQEPQDIHSGQEPQDSYYAQQPQEPHHQDELHDYQLPSQDTHHQEEPQNPSSQQLSQGTKHQKEPVYQQEPQGTPYNEVAMEIVDPPVSHDYEVGFYEDLGNVIQDGSAVEHNMSHPIIKLSQEDNTPSAEKEALINETNKEIPTGLDHATSNNSLTSAASQSPMPGNGRESFLSQIRQFNKAKLKKQISYPESSSFDQLQSLPSERRQTQDELQKMEDGRESPQENVDASNLLSTLHQVLQHRARALHDTLSSADEFDSSDDNDEDEWDL